MVNVLNVLVNDYLLTWCLVLHGPPGPLREPPLNGHPRYNCQNRAQSNRQNFTGFPTDCKSFRPSLSSTVAKLFQIFLANSTKKFGKILKIATN
jgi:hypothetical protein